MLLKIINWNTNLNLELTLEKSNKNTNWYLKFSINNHDFKFETDSIYK